MSADDWIKIATAAAIVILAIAVGISVVLAATDSYCKSIEEDDE